MLFSPISTKQEKFLSKTAGEIRIDIIQMLSEAGSGHPAGSLGMTDVFTALYFFVLKHDPKRPNWKERDFVILSNGHICPVQYAALARSGYFPQSELMSLRKINSRLQGHPHCHNLPGIETTSGPLGQGISQACGLALALKMDHKNNHVYSLVSDGEQQEGQTWEAYQLAHKYNLSNLTAVVDRNFIQIEGSTEVVMPLEDLQNKLKAFGWKTYVIDGHNYKEIIKALQQARNDQQPSIIIANTTPGKGVSFMEGKSEWHGKAPDKKQAAQAIKELQS